MKAILYSAIVCAVTAGAYAQSREQTMPTLAIRDGETLVFKHVTSYTNCKALYKRTTAVDMLEGPEELSFTADERPEVAAPIPDHACKGNPGAYFCLTAKAVTEKKEGNVTVRVKTDTTRGPWQVTLRSHVLVFPAKKPAAKPQTQESQEVTPHAKGQASLAPGVSDLR